MVEKNHYKCPLCNKQMERFEKKACPVCHADTFRRPLPGKQNFHFCVSCSGMLFPINQMKEKKVETKSCLNDHVLLEGMVEGVDMGLGHYVFEGLCEVISWAGALVPDLDF